MEAIHTGLRLKIMAIKYAAGSAAARRVGGIIRRKRLRSGTPVKKYNQALQMTPNVGAFEPRRYKTKRFEKMLHLFTDLALGTRFQYANRNEKVWVKIGIKTIAEWDEAQKANNWIGQQICCFSDTDDIPVYVRVL